ncbi:MAG TPA: hypothetical protein DEQ47_05030 [Solibacterales bacterium]|nr:hypothetical protein [Bryobacterales bacterium]
MAVAVTVALEPDCSAASTPCTAYTSLPVSFKVAAEKLIGEERQEEPPEPAPRSNAQRPKLLVRKGERSFIIDPQELIYATIDNGVITLVAVGVEGLSNYKTLEELHANLDPDVFWRTHRSFLVNINRIREVVPWFKSSYQIRVDDKKGTEIPVSRVQTRRLRELLKL